MIVAWFNWWWDTLGLARGQVLTGVLSSVLAVIAIVYAWRVARRQFAMMDEQTAISKRQIELAEKQDKIIQEQRTRRAVLTLEMQRASYSFTDDTRQVHLQQHWLYLVNSGDKPAREVYFRVLVPCVGGFDPKLQVIVPSIRLEVDDEMTEEYDKFVFAEGRCPGPIYPGQSIPCVQISVAIPHEPYQKHRLDACDYRLEWEDGKTPQTGYATLSLRRTFTFTAEEIQAASS